MADNANEQSEFGSNAPAGAATNRPAPGGLDAEIELDEVLVGSKHTLDEDKIVVDGPLMKEGGGMIGIVLLILAVIGGAVGVFYVYSDDTRREELSAFWSGNIKEYKEADKVAAERWQRQINNETRNRYGTVVLEYSPKNASVTIKKLGWSETLDQYVDRVMKGGDDMRQGPTEEIVPNKSSELKEHEMVDSLPLSDLALVERSEDDTKMFTYAYDITISRDGYYDRKFMFITDDFPGKTTDDQQVMKWEQTGPDIYAIGWSGADLMPKPEMMRPNYVKAIVEFNCLKNSPEGKKKTQDELEYEFTVLKRNNSFATDTQWNEVEAALRANAELWPAIETEIAEAKCEE